MLWFLWVVILLVGFCTVVKSIIKHETLINKLLFIYLTPQLICIDLFQDLREERCCESLPPELLQWTCFQQGLIYAWNNHYLLKCMYPTWCLTANKFERCCNVNYGQGERNRGYVTLRQHAFVCVFGLEVFFGVCFASHSFKVHEQIENKISLC